MASFLEEAPGHKGASRSVVFGTKAEEKGKKSREVSSFRLNQVRHKGHNLMNSRFAPPGVPAGCPVAVLQAHRGSSHKHVPTNVVLIKSARPAERIIGVAQNKTDMGVGLRPYPLVQGSRIFDLRVKAVTGCRGSVFSKVVGCFCDLSLNRRLFHFFNSVLLLLARAQRQACMCAALTPFVLRAACHGAWVFRVLCFFVSYSIMLCANAFMHVTVHEGVALCIMLCM